MINSCHPTFTEKRRTWFVSEHQENDTNVNVRDTLSLKYLWSIFIGYNLVIILNANGTLAWQRLPGDNNENVHSPQKLVEPTKCVEKGKTMLKRTRKKVHQPRCVYVWKYQILCVDPCRRAVSVRLYIARTHCADLCACTMHVMALGAQYAGV